MTEGEAVTEPSSADDQDLGQSFSLLWSGLSGMALGLAAPLLVAGAEAAPWAKASLVFLWQALGAFGFGARAALQREPRAAELVAAAFFFVPSTLGLAFFWPWSELGSLSLLLAEGWIVLLSLLSFLLVTTLCLGLGEAWGFVASSVILVGVWLQPLTMSPVLQSLPRAWRAEGLRWVLSTTPLFIVCGSFLGVDLMTSQALYERFSIGQSEPGGYAAPLAIVGGTFLLVLVLGLIWAILRSWRGGVRR